MLRVPYFETRHYLRLIAEKSHSNINGVDVIIKGKEAIFKFVQRYKNDKWIMFPTDDDDFYSPEIVDNVLEFSGYDFSGVDVVTWDTLSLNTCGRLRICYGLPNRIGSNAYAITNKVAKRVPNQVEEIIARHSAAGKYKNCRHNTGGMWALYNCNISSLSSLTKEKDIIDLWDKEIMRAYFESTHQIVSKPFVHDVQWVADYGNEIFQVLRSCIDL